MTQEPITGTGTEGDPWNLKTPSLGSEIEMHQDEDHDPPVLEALGRAEVEHNARNNRMRAL